MITEQGHFAQEKEQHLGLTTLEIGRVVVDKTPQIQRVHLRRYFHVPDRDRTSVEEKVYVVDRQTFLHSEVVGKLMEKLDPGWNISLDSQVEGQKGELLQFPMMDLALNKSPENLERTKQRLKKIIVPDFGGGFILETEKSYHFFGEKPFNQEKLNQFLGLCLLTSIVTVTPDGQPNIHEMVADYRYVGHSLIRGSTGLRITTNGTKTFTPRVIATI